jgi:hypothetical protein
VKNNIIDIYFVWISIAQSASSPLHGLSTTNIENVNSIFILYSLLVSIMSSLISLSENHYYKDRTNIENDVKAVREGEYLRQQ